MTIRRPDPREQQPPEAGDPLASAVWIRPFARGDDRAVRELVTRVLGEFDLTLDPEGTDADLADVEAAYRGGGGEFWVVEDGTGRIVGTCGLWPVPGDAARCELRKMYLDPSLRGRGMGRQLLETALEHARAAGRTRVELETNHRMTAAMALYEAYGFRRTAHGGACTARCDRAYALELG
ncbi:MAG TPA: GNAT family N-acetyltransferase [Gemmatimonadota bacterium]|nr:GNAT family N-acetyltransferase [Gemmatimonadota bacterium]